MSSSLLMVALLKIKMIDWIPYEEATKSCGKSSYLYAMFMVSVHLKFFLSDFTFPAFPSPPEIGFGTGSGFTIGI